MQGLLRIPPHRALKQMSSTVEVVMHVQPPYPQLSFADLTTSINARLSNDLGSDGIALSALTAVSKQGIAGNGLCETGELSTATPLPPNAGAC